ncbi:hypothetical protein [Caenimonas sp. SL110]|uniref:hypothetical protein n=1 Tax=Caenimonas sp. SL110 TaxID=1450524 RepID=UPI0006548F2D|nr:hypothetical protein [Caenimonas sp. SL110]
MFGITDLKPSRPLDGNFVACPVLGCQVEVPVQHRTFKAKPTFLCPAHRIYIGRSTFEYQSDNDNLLWTSAAGLALLARIEGVKRESRMARERSEDALSWNVFRHLELSGRLGSWVASLTGAAAVAPRIHYWSFDDLTGATWEPLARARGAFGEVDGRGSEPDLIISTADTHIWVEAKFGSTNNTRPSDEGGAEARYTEGAANWYARAVKSPFQAVAIHHRRYELLRLWLLGSWVAAQDGKRFELVNLVRHGSEEGVLAFAKEHFEQSPTRRMHRVTWESVCAFISSADGRTPEDDALLGYMRDKTLGYSPAGKIVRAFAVD